MLLAWSAVGTGLLMLRTLRLQYDAWRQANRDQAPAARAWMRWSWLISVFAAVAAPWWLPLPAGRPDFPPMQELAGLLWPVIVSLLLGLGFLWLRAWSAFFRALITSAGGVPAGDLWRIYIFLALALTRCSTAVERTVRPLSSFLQQLLMQFNGRIKEAIVRLEMQENRFRIIAGTLTVVLVLVLAVMSR